ncbi:wax ester/triacylglycerol synthase family O-acyltransferase [Nocardioides sp.]|uniref:WS/DGAT/MGAT family O-acyltransferase n=1 Tax=Nocardioides sp. TaxID=35761 RepID=UPI002628B236|nr:wax ester/triacylglycerol synthase family O-acyltransferase [Nocardioides sp.]
MGDRLTPRDLTFLVEERPSAPRHNATVEIFEPGPEGFRYDDLVALVEDRLSFVPRYRQKLRFMPGGVANPVWVDDPAFDISYHVRLSALPRPGSAEELEDLVGRIVARPLDRQRPLWEMYLIEGVDGGESGRFAILTKSHQALVDGVETIDLGHLLLDLKPDVDLLGEDVGHAPPSARPTAMRMLLGVAHDALTDPHMVLETVSSRGLVLARAVNRAARLSRGQERITPLTGRLSQQRRFVGVDTPLADLRRVRSVHGGTVNDVILAVIAGALRSWLMSRTESVGGLRQLRAVVPVAVIDENEEATSLGSQIAVHVVDLPVGEASPVVRLHQVSWSFESHQEAGRGVPASRLAGITGFAPTTFHAVGNRAAAARPDDSYHLVVTNVPGPQTPLYAASARMVATYPVPPLTPGHALTIGVTSYDGTVYLGINTDRDLIPDTETLRQCFVEAIDELVDSASGTRQRAPRGRAPGTTSDTPSTQTGSDS